MNDPSDLQKEIDDVEEKIGSLESKEERLEAALAGNGSYLGTNNHRELRSFYKVMMREKEQLRKKEEQLRTERQFVLLRQQQMAVPSSGRLGEAAESSSSDDGECASTASNPVKQGGADSPAGSTSATGVSSPSDAGDDPAESDGDARLMPEDESEMQVFVKSPTGKTYAIHMFPSDTVMGMKEKCQRRTGIPAKDQIITWAGKGLFNNDQQTLRDCKIERECTVHLHVRVRGGKPVILLYPSAPLDATVALELSPLWSFSALYPKPPSSKLQQAALDPEAVVADQQCKWSVHASPDGSLEDLSTGREYPYLFWEADSSDGRVSQSFGLDETRSFCVAGDAAGVFLDGALECLGLNMRERCDMVTYWLPELESSPFNVIYFVGLERYEKAARLTIVPAPDVTIRVFMAFRGVDEYDAELDTAKMEDLRGPARKGFVAVEWGGMNLNGASHD